MERLGFADGDKSWRTCILLWGQSVGVGGGGGIGVSWLMSRLSYFQERVAGGESWKRGSVKNSFFSFFSKSNRS